MTIVQRQHLLAYLGYYEGACDGLWGPQSSDACIRFQTDYCLDPDGIWGPITEKMVIGVISGTVARKEPVQNGTVEVVPGEDFWPKLHYFKRTDPGIACPCGRCTGFPVEPYVNLMLEADLMRDTLGHPMTPSSTVRCQAHNDELPGSVPNSWHVKGHAMDFDIPAVSDQTIINYLNQRKASGHIYSWYQMTSGWFHFQVK